MQNAALEAAGLPMRYARFQISVEELPRALKLVSEFGFVGVNLTIPHKLRAIEFLEEQDEFCRAVGAVNCIRVGDGKLLGSNTDGAGFSAAIRSEFAAELRELRILLLGTGGAGQAIATQCAREGCQRLVLTNRSRTTAEELSANLQRNFGGLKINVIPCEESALRPAISNSDLVVNATPVGMRRTDASLIPADWLREQLFVYDTVYEPDPTALLVAARESGARAAGGLSMLLHQGALSFEAWFGRAAPLEAMAAALRQ